MFQIACAADRILPRQLIAAGANLLLQLRNDDSRSFSVDSRGNWVNRQPAATFVSPDIYTSEYDQVRDRVLEYWCYGYTPKPGDTVVEIGAGIGEEAVIFSHLVGPEGRVIAVEAHPQTFACLEATIAQSGLANVVAVQCAITNEDGQITISDSNVHVANSVLDAGGGVTVRSRSLDSLLDELGVATVDLLKMNIEGAEQAAVKGMANSARRMRYVAISCHDFIADAGGSEQFRTREFIKAALRDHGFEIAQRTDAPHPWLRDTVFGRRAG